jgi:YVTN family beta-propeller protein
VLGTFPVGQLPWQILFDGTSIWVTNRDQDSVTKLRVSDGTELAIVPVGNSPVGLAYDGANIWVTNIDSGTITVVRASDATVLRTISFKGLVFPFYPAFDGRRMWVTDAGKEAVLLLRANDGAHAGRVKLTDFPYNIIWDGTSMWTVLELSDSVTKITLQW